MLIFGMNTLQNSKNVTQLPSFDITKDFNVIIGLGSVRFVFVKNFIL